MQVSLIACTCLVTATVSLAIGEKIQRGIGQGQQAFFQYQVPDQGFTIQVTVGMGQIAICGSTTIERPSCSVATVLASVLGSNPTNKL